MRSLWLLGAMLTFVGCATTSSGGGADTRLPSLKDVMAAAKAQSWGGELKQIPASVVDVGELKDVPYVSFAGGEVELNVYGDPEKPAGIEVGTKSESPELRAALKTFIANLLNEKDRAPLLALTEGAVVTDGLEVEVTPPTAEDGFGAWWVDAAHPAALETARASVGDMNEIARAPVEEQDTLAFADVGMAPGFARYARFRPATGKKIYATNYYKKDGAYRRR